MAKNNCWLLTSTPCKSVGGFVCVGQFRWVCVCVNPLWRLTYERRVEAQGNRPGLSGLSDIQNDCITKYKFKQRLPRPRNFNHGCGPFFRSTEKAKI